MEKKETLCFHCANACTNGCNWSKNLEPVEGWTAEKNNQGYLVTDCPQFYPDDVEDGRLKNIDTDGMMRLLEAVAQQMRDDYIHGRGIHDPNAKRAMTWAESRYAARKQIERWITGGNGKTLLMLSDPEEVVRQLRAMARMHDQELVEMMGW